MNINTVSLVVDETYHIFTKSIAGYQIFNDDNEYSRILNLLKYYNLSKSSCRFSWSIRSQNEAHKANEPVQLIAYCIMPTHIHLILKQLSKNGISSFMNKILNSYTRYFNTKHKRKGPLWESRFNRVLIKTNEQLLHLTRYIHLNPTSAHLVESPEHWKYSSYYEYISKSNATTKLCEFNNILDVDPTDYKKFVEDRIGYQQELSKIKKLLLDKPFHTYAV